MITLLRRGWAHITLAAIIYIPLLLTLPGKVVADTKQYLFLDPAEMLSASTSLWDPDWALGTVTHQSVGYLWPMGPWYAFFDAIGSPVWVAQRLWIGSILFAAATGILHLRRIFGWSDRAAFLAAALYALSPYALAYATRISALLMPWAGLPWLLAFAIQALRASDQHGMARWRDPARLALVGTTVGAINASSLIYVGVAVIAWFPYAVYSAREAKAGPAIATMARIGVCLTLASAWWAVALVVQGQWGPDVLRFSETLEVVASGSSASEAWRGLGYWIFYGGDRTGLWVTAAETYTQNLAVLVATFALSMVGLAVLLLVRWQYRVYMLGLAIGGLLLTIGLYPYDSPSPLGSLVVDGAAESTLALALRSSPRAMPLFLLAVAAQAATGFDIWMARTRPSKFKVGVIMAAGLALVAAAIPPLWTGGYVGAELARDEAVSTPWLDAAVYLNEGEANERVLILPGADFSAHDWGNTIDHMLPGLIERPVAVRELVAYGGSEAADLLIALDRRAQERVLTPNEAAPIARLLGAGDVIVQSDLEWERYRTPRPDDLWRVLNLPGIGFGDPVWFGPSVENAPSDAFPMLDEIELSLPVDLENPPAVAALPVEDALGVIRLRTAESPIVVAGDGESLVDLAGIGLLDPDRVVLYERTLSDEDYTKAMASNATLILTDGNRLRARRWKSVRDTLGFTETGEEATGGRAEVGTDPTDARLDTDAALIAAGDLNIDDLASRTVAELTTADGAPFAVRVSSYGNPISYHPEDRGFSAVDGDPTTSWRAATFGEPEGEWIELEWPDGHPVTSQQPTSEAVLVLAQPFTLNPDRFLTAVSVSVNGGPGVPVDLDERSRTIAGQSIPITVADGVINSVRIDLVAASEGGSGIGFSEIQVRAEGSEPGFDSENQPTEFLAMPTSPAARGPLDDQNAIAVVMSRDRVDEASSVRDDPQTAIRRIFDLPAERAFTLTGEVTLAGRASDSALATQTGDPVLVQANRTMPGPASGRAAVIFDADPTTLWRPPLGQSVGASLTMNLGAARTIDKLDLTLAVDDRHSLPSLLSITGITAQGTETETVMTETAVVPLLTSGGEADGATEQVAINFGAIEAETLVVTVLEVESRRSTDWYSAQPLEQPVGIAELVIPGGSLNGRANGPLGQVSSACRRDLVIIDGEPALVRLEPGTDGGFILSSCDEVALAAGEHRIETADRSSGLAVNRLALISDGSLASSAGLVEGSSVPVLNIAERGRSAITVEVDDATEPFWLVLGESHSEGWEASIEGGQQFGPAQLVDGFANGWFIDPATIEAGASGTGSLRIVMTWVPNSTVHIGLWLSALSIVALLGIAILGRPRIAQPIEASGSSIVSPMPLTVFGGLARAGLLGLGLGAITSPMVGAAACCCVLVGGLVPRGRTMMRLGALAALALVGAYVTVQQSRYGAPHDGAWPSLWDRAHVLGLLAIAGLAGEWTLSSREAQPAAPVVQR